MKKKRWNRTGLIACGLTLTVVASACASGGETENKGTANKGTEPAAAEAKKTRTIKFMTPYFNAEPPKSDLEALKKNSGAY